MPTEVLALRPTVMKKEYGKNQLQKESDLLSEPMLSLHPRYHQSCTIPIFLNNNRKKTEVQSPAAPVSWKKPPPSSVALSERKHRSFPTTFIVMLSFWLSMLFCSFGLFTPRHATVITVLGISALSVAGALFLILEMNSPLEGAIKISSGSLQTALSHLGKGVMQ